MHELTRAQLSEIASEPNCCMLAALGYENRSRFVPSRIAASAKGKMAVSFESEGVHAFDRNKRWFEKSNFKIVPNDDEFVSVFVGELGSINPTCAIIDISCMTRKMIASVVVALADILKSCGEAVFTYAPAVFSAPPKRLLPITYSAPVTDDFAGWQTDMTKPVSAVVGLGFEYDRALGALERFEVNAAWLFIPEGEDPRYERETLKLNAPLIERTRASGVNNYRVDDPIELYVRLESLVFGLVKTTRPLVLPFGPKIFALVSLLVAKAHAPHVTVWRVSGYRPELVADRRPNGKVIALRVRGEP